MTAWNPDTWTDPRTSPCPACGKTVEFAAGRRRCIDCRTWIHEKCGINPMRKDGRIFCQECARKNAREIVKGITRAINESDEQAPSLEVVVWSSRFGQDEAEISAELGIPAEKVADIAASLREHGFWRDGSLFLEHDEEGGPDEVGFQIMVSMVLASLVADGLVEREPVGPGAEPVPGEGGTDQDGKQEDDKGDPSDST